MPLYLISNIYVESPVSNKFPATFPYRTHYDWKDKFALRAIVNAANPKNAYKMVERQFKIVVHTKKHNADSAFIRSELHPTVCIRPISFIHPDFATWWNTVTNKVRKTDYAAFVLNPIQYKLTPYTRLSGRANLVLNAISSITRRTDLTPEERLKAVQGVLYSPYYDYSGANRINDILDNGRRSDDDKNESQVLESYLSKAHHGTCCHNCLTCLRCYAEATFVLPSTSIYFTDMAKAYRIIYPRHSRAKNKPSK